MEIDVSIILPVYNADAWLNECLESVLKQSALKQLKLELSVHDDGSDDQTAHMLEKWKSVLENHMKVTFSKSNVIGRPKGVGWAKNRAIEQSTGRYLCFLDADDIMMENRIMIQYEAALRNPNAIIGCKFLRIPEGSTERYTRWANNLSREQYYTQIYTSHGPTVIMPTWFCSREVFQSVGGFSEAGRGTPEDLIFFYQHLDLEGSIFCVDQELLLYRYHPSATTFSVPEKVIWDIRIARIQEKVLRNWHEFTIWNAGKQGRRFFRSLSEEFRRKVKAFCDVDSKKIDKSMYTFEESKASPKPQVPIVHYTQAKSPFIICVKLDMTGGRFEDNLKKLNLQEGTDFFHFN